MYVRMYKVSSPLEEQGALKKDTDIILDYHMSDVCITIHTDLLLGVDTGEVALTRRTS